MAQRKRRVTEKPAEFRLNMTLLHGSVRGRIEAVHLSKLCDADGFRASDLQHAVQDHDGDGNLGRLACIGARP